MSPAPLVCPACRHVVGGDLHVRTLAPVGGLLGCDCGATYPVVDGIPIVFRDVDTWLRSEGVEALRRHDLPDDVAARIAVGTGGAAARNASLVDVYTRSREGALQDWLRDRIAALDGAILEMGAGIGASSRPDVLALDHNLALLRHHPAARVCGDAADPPFLPASFDAVVLANVLDSCAQPGLILAQADALLRPGGRLIVTCAYAFHEDITPRGQRFGPQELAAALDGRAPLLGYGIPHRRIEEIDRVAWPLALSERLTHVHAAHALISVKSG
ncbi:MAG: methyltransferase domain-containing protein [Pseudomonadota bacterium]|nr:methyltransferase domain-containing protein [Pseudomonadota bacterium]